MAVADPCLTTHPRAYQRSVQEHSDITQTPAERLYICKVIHTIYTQNKTHRWMLSMEDCRHASRQDTGHTCALVKQEAMAMVSSNP